MEGDLSFFAALCLLPLGFAGALYLFFTKPNFYRSRRYLALVLGNVLVFCFLCLVLWLVGEMYYRFVYDTTHGANATRASQRWFKRHWRLNSAGMRDSVSRYRRDVAPGKRRVIFVGDSFTAGHGVSNVEDRFVNLYRARRPNREVHMLAACGWDTGEHLQVLRNYAEAGGRFDLVVLCYCLNDPSDLVGGMSDIFQDYGRTPNYLCRHSYFLNTMYWRLQDALTARQGDMYGGLLLKGYDGHAWDQQRQRLQQLTGVVRANGGRLAVVTFPLFHRSLAGPDYKYAVAHQRLNDWWEQLHVPHLDLLAAYRKYRPEDLWVNRHDWHPNVLAHRVAADAIVDFLDPL